MEVKLNTNDSCLSSTGPRLCKHEDGTTAEIMHPTP